MTHPETTNTQAPENANAGVLSGLEAAKSALVRGRVGQGTKTALNPVEQQLALIKSHMPQTYASIQAKATELGKPAYALVRRGLRGEPNCFYAFERGHVVGTPFTLTEVTRDIAQYMVTFGCTNVVVWASPPSPVTAPPSP